MYLSYDSCQVGCFMSNKSKQKVKNPSKNQADPAKDTSLIQAATAKCTAIIGASGAILAATIGALALILTTILRSGTLPPYICPLHGQTDDETIVNLINAEAEASNTKDLRTIQGIFDRDADFYDYAVQPPKQWNGTLARYRDNLFQTTEFQKVEHFDILPVGPGIDGDTAYYTSGSQGSYRINGGPWTDFYNGSLISMRFTQYGSEHWLLRRNFLGCWKIVRMDFNAGHIKFP